MIKGWRLRHLGRLKPMTRALSAFRRSSFSTTTRTPRTSYRLSPQQPPQKCLGEYLEATVPLNFVKSHLPLRPQLLQAATVVNSPQCKIAPTQPSPNSLTKTRPGHGLLEQASRSFFVNWPRVKHRRSVCILVDLALRRLKGTQS